MSYIKIEEVRKEGISEQEISDEELLKKIKEAEQFIDLVTGDHFEQEVKILKLSGRGYNEIFFDEETDLDCIYLLSVKVNGELKDLAEFENLRDGLLWKSGEFPRGEKNIEVMGIFGWEETPEPIKKVCLKLVKRAVRPEENIGVFKSQRIGDYSYELRGEDEKAITGDPEIDDILNRYKKLKVRVRVF